MKAINNNLVAESILVLALLGSLQVIRAEENSVNTVTTNSAGAAPRRHIITEFRPSAPSKVEQSKNAGRLILTSSLDAEGKSLEGKPLGTDNMITIAANLVFIAAVRDSWHRLLESRPLPERAGRVVLQFIQHQDGRVTEVKVLSSTVGEDLSLLCQKAVLDPSPFPRWPRELRKQIAADSRTVTFTFSYLPDEAHRKK